MNAIRDNKIMKISKIQDKVEMLEVRGKGCDEDCKLYVGNTSETIPGCMLTWNCQMTCAL